MSDDEQAILRLTRENEQLKRENQELKDNQNRAESAMRKVGVPGYFEDGNDSDNLSFNEQVGILCDMYLRAKQPKP